jgi:fructose transport system permease protein
VFGLANGRFFKPENLSIILQQTAVVGSLAIGQTLIDPHRRHRSLDRRGDGALDPRDGQARRGQRTPGILASAHRPFAVAVPRPLNGLLVTRIKLPPFIVTLGTLSIFTALTLIYAQGQT